MANPERKDFIGFIVESEHNKDLVSEFWPIDNADALYTFFQDRGFTDIQKLQCKDILAVKDRLSKGGIIPDKRHGPCEGSTKGY